MTDLARLMEADLPLLPPNPAVLAMPPPLLPEALSHLDHLSYSSLWLYQSCARAWAYKYLLQLPSKSTVPLEVGKVFHAIVEERVRRRISGEPHDMLTAFEAAWAQTLANPAIDWGSELPDEHHSMLYRILMKPETQAVIDTLDPFIVAGRPLVEVPFKLAVEGVPISIDGRIDMIATMQAIPLDFKTSRSKWDQAKADAEVQPDVYVDYLDQVGLGALNTNRLFGHVVVVKTKDPYVQMIWTQRTPQKVAWMRQAYRDIWQGIESGRFTPNATSWKCTPHECDAWDVCRGAAAGTVPMPRLEGSRLVTPALPAA